MELVQFKCIGYNLLLVNLNMKYNILFDTTCTSDSYPHKLTNKIPAKQLSNCAIVLVHFNHFSRIKRGETYIHIC